MTKEAVDSYLCSDGKPITNSSVFNMEDEKSPYTEFRHRDRRLLFTVCPPYRIKTPPIAFSKEWVHTDNPADAEYFSVMKTISSEGYKLLPIRQNAPMVVAEIDASFNPRRDPSVNPVLWEIRRERRVELMGDGYRFDDLRRWKKCDYINKQKLGRWYSAKQLVEDGLIKNESQCKLQFKGGGKEGYVEFFTDPVKEGYGWKDLFISITTERFGY